MRYRSAFRSKNSYHAGMKYAGLADSLKRFPRSGRDIKFSPINVPIIRRPDASQQHRKTDYARPTSRYACVRTHGTGCTLTPFAINLVHCSLRAKLWILERSRIIPSAPSSPRLSAYNRAQLLPRSHREIRRRNPRSKIRKNYAWRFRQPLQSKRQWHGIYVCI